MRSPTAYAVAIGVLVVVAAACADDAALPDVPSATAPGSAPASRLEPNADVVHVVDGDTIDVEIQGHTERVRLIGIDTPEIAHASSGARPPNAAECFGAEAHQFTRRLVPTGTGVRIERDIVGRDDYGRLLAYVFRADDGIFVNYEIVRHGFARPLTIAPNVVHADLFVDAARRAEADDVGLWAVCG